HFYAERGGDESTRTRHAGRDGPGAGGPRARQGRRAPPAAHWTVCPLLRGRRVRGARSRWYPDPTLPPAPVARLVRPRHDGPGQQLLPALPAHRGAGSLGGRTRREVGSLSALALGEALLGDRGRPCGEHSAGGRL